MAVLSRWGEHVTVLIQPEPTSLVSCLEMEGGPDTMSWCACRWNKRPRHQWLSCPTSLPPSLLASLPACLSVYPAHPACCGGSMIIATAGQSSFVSHTLLHLARGHRVCLAPYRAAVSACAFSVSRQAELETGEDSFFMFEMCVHSPS